MVVDPVSLWDRVEELVDRAPSLDALRAHGLHLVAARVWRSRGLSVPSDLVAEERRAAMIAMAAPILLKRARAAYGGELMLMKGPEAAARYPHPADRFFRDLDILADDAPMAQRGLIAAGFVEFGDPSGYDDAQHLCPLIWPGFPLVIELHRFPNRPPWLPRVSASEVLALGVPSITGVDGLLAPAAPAHALLLTAHRWAHQPLGRVADLLDVAAVLSDGGRRRAGEIARDWGWDGMSRVALAAGGAVLNGDHKPVSMRLWARHLASARETTVIENHASRIAAPACTVPAKRVPRAVAASMLRTAARREGEQWADKLRRSGLAVAHAFSDTSEHERTLTPTHTRSSG
jgi:hypothetical protein